MVGRGASDYEITEAENGEAALAAIVPSISPTTVFAGGTKACAGLAYAVDQVKKLPGRAEQVDRPEKASAPRHAMMLRN